MYGFEEYKFFGKRIQHLSERRQVASRTYLTVNTAIFAVLAFLVNDVGFRGWQLVLVGLPLFLVGVVACAVWQKIISDFRQISGWHYEQLREMEETLPNSSKLFSKEWEQFFKPKGGRERFGFSQLEAWLPKLFLGLYAVYGVGLVAAAAIGWV